MGRLKSHNRGAGGGMPSARVADVRLYGAPSGLNFLPGAASMSTNAVVLTRRRHFRHQKGRVAPKELSMAITTFVRHRARAEGPAQITQVGRYTYRCRTWCLRLK